MQLFRKAGVKQDNMGQVLLTTGIYGRDWKAKIPDRYQSSEPFYISRLGRAVPPTTCNGLA